MSSYILRRLSARPSCLSSSLPGTLQRATPTTRSYVITTKGDAPSASNVTDNPQSNSTEESSVKTSRALDSTPNRDSASVQPPISGENMQNEGDESPDNDLVKQDKDKPAAEKKKQVESLGDKPLGPEDHQ